MVIEKERVKEVVGGDIKIKGKIYKWNGSL
jgi:hypothetical protein